MLTKSFIYIMKYLLINCLLFMIVYAENSASLSLTEGILYSNDATNFPLGCASSVPTTRKGLSMEIYSYDHRKKGSSPCWDAAYLDPNYPRTGYKTHRLISKVDGVTGNISFQFHAAKSCKSELGYLPPAYNYTKPLTLTNFTMLLYGYFKPKITGYHTFSIKADDLLFLNFGAGNAFDCCQRESSADNFGNYQAYAIWGSKNAKNELTVRLDAGIYYPIRVFFNNRDYYGALSFTLMTEFSEEIVTDFSEYFFSLDDTDLGCPALIYYNTSCASVDESTILDVDYKTETEATNIIPITKTIYHIGIPCGASTTTNKCGSGFYDPLGNKCVTISTLSTSSTITASNSQKLPTTYSSHISESLSLPSTTTTKTKETTSKKNSYTSENAFFSTESKTETSSKIRPNLSSEVDYTTVVSNSDGSVLTDIVSHITTTDSDGKPTTIVTTYPSPSDDGHDRTAVVSNSDGSVLTDIVSHITTTDSDGKPTTIVTTVPLTTVPLTNPSSEADYTTVVSNSDGSVLTDIVSHITTTDSDGKPTTIVTTVPLTNPSSEADYTTVVSNSDGSVLTDIVSHITTTDSDGKPTTIVTTVPLTTVPLTNPSSEADYTTVVSNSDGSVLTDIVSHITTTDSDGKPTTIVTTVPLTTVPLTNPSSEADYTTVVSNSDGSVLTDIVSHITTTDSDGKPTTIVTTVPLTTVPLTNPSSEADYTTVVSNSDGSVLTDIVSHITTTDSDGKPTTIVTTYPSPSDDGHDRTTVVSNSDGSVLTDIVSHITTTDSDGKPTTIVTTVPLTTVPLTNPSSEADYTTVVSNSDGSVLTDIVSHITTTDSDGKPTTIVTTVPLTTVPLTNPSSEADYTTVVSNSDGSVLTDIVSHITTTDSDGKPTTIVTTVPLTTVPLTNPSSEADYTTVVSNSDGSVLTDIVSHITTTDSDGKPTTIVTTVPLTTVPLTNPSSEADYTTVVSNSDGSVLTDIVSHITTTDSDGKPTTIVTTVPLTTVPLTNPSSEADYTTVVSNSDGSVLTDIVSHITTTDSDGKPTTIVTTYPSPSDDGHDRTTVVSNSDGSVLTDIVSHITTTDSDGKPTTIVTTVPLTTVPLTNPSSEADYTTVVSNSDGSVLTDIVSHITTTDSDGKPTTIVTTYPSPSDDGHDRTTVVSNSDGSVLTDIVSHITTTDSDGKPTTIVTTVPLTTVPLTNPSSEADYTTVVSNSDGSVLTDIVSHITTTDSDGKPTTIVTTVPLTTVPLTNPSSEADYTTVVSNSDGSVLTDIVSHITTTDSDGKPTTIVTTVPLTTVPLTNPSSEADYTTVVSNSDGSVLTDIVSHITTTDSDGKPTTIVTTVPLTNPSSEADYTTVVSNSDGSVLTDIVSHITTTDSDGKPTTIVTTYPSPSDDGHDRTTVVSNSDGSVLTDIVSHITTTDSDGKPTTIVTTVPLTTVPLTNPSSEADYTTVVSNSDGSVLTDIVSHITTTDSDGKPTTIVTTVPLTTVPLTNPSSEADYTTWSPRRQRAHRHRLPHHHHGLRRQAYHHRDTSH
ncbi:hypothetical protein J7295_01246 [Nakaseomyces glabratus]|nr:hypothetical protein J7295_01246 [Nakaseomyces glabratus]